MPGTTPKLGFPFPTGTDRVMDGDNAIAALAGSVEDQLTGGAGGLHFVPMTRATIISGTALASFARSLSPAIGGVPANAKLVAGYGNAWSDVKNVSNYIQLYQSEAGTNDIGAVLKVGGTTVHDEVAFAFHVGCVQSGGAKVSFAIGRAGGTITYAVYCTGYWIPAA